MTAGDDIFTFDGSSRYASAAHKRASWLTIAVRMEQYSVCLWHPRVIDPVQFPCAWNPVP
jgi:hypothetical protein